MITRVVWQFGFWLQWSVTLVSTTQTMRLWFKRPTFRPRSRAWNPRRITRFRFGQGRPEDGANTPPSFSKEPHMLWVSVSFFSVLYLFFCTFGSIGHHLFLSFFGVDVCFHHENWIYCTEKAKILTGNREFHFIPDYVGDDDNMQVRIIAGAIVAVVVLLVIIIIMIVLFLRR